MKIADDTEISIRIAKTMTTTMIAGVVIGMDVVVAVDVVVRIIDAIAEASAEISGIRGTMIAIRGIPTLVATNREVGKIGAVVVVEIVIVDVDVIVGVIVDAIVIVAEIVIVIPNRKKNAVPTKNTANASKNVTKRAKVRNRIRAIINAKVADVNAKTVSSKINTIIAYRKAYVRRARIAAKMNNGPTKRASRRRHVNRPVVWTNCPRIAPCIVPTADAYANRATSEIRKENA